METNHVIGKIILELHAQSRQQAGEVHEDIRQILYSMIVPAIEKYCDGIRHSGGVTRLDKLELDLGNLTTPFLIEDIHKSIDACFKKLKHRTTATRNQVVRQELSDRESLLGFLTTGILPWHVPTGRSQVISTLLVNAASTRKDATEIFTSILRHAQMLRRLLAHISDTVLWHMALLMNSGGHPKVSMAGDLLFKYSRRRLSADRRFFLWRSVMQRSLGDSVSPEIFLNRFMFVYAAACNVTTVQIREDILAEIHVSDMIDKDSESVVAMLKAVREAAGAEGLSETLMDNELYYIQETYRKNTLDFSSDRRWLADLQMDIASIMFRYAHLAPLAVQRVVKDCLLKSLALWSDKPKGKARILKDRLLRELTAFGDYSRSIQILIEKVRGYGHERHPVVQAIGDLLGRSHELHTTEQFSLFLDRIEHVIAALPNSVYEADIGIWVQDLKRELLRQRISNPGRSDFMKLLSDVKALCLADGNDLNIVNAFLRKLMDAFSFFIQGSRVALFRQLLDDFERYNQSSSIEVNKADILERISRIAGKESDPHQEAVIDAVEIYVKNAGLVLLSPFIIQLFQSIDLPEHNGFNNNKRKSIALALLQHLADPEAPWLEYEIPLIKLLCGFDVSDMAVPVDVDEKLKVQTEEMLSQFLSQEQVFRNISLEGFRNAFLQREGVLRLYGNHAVLVVNRETFDIVLDKIQWDYHIIRYPWMKFPLMVEW